MPGPEMGDVVQKCKVQKLRAEELETRMRCDRSENEVVGDFLRSCMLVSYQTIQIPPKETYELHSCSTTGRDQTTSSGVGRVINRSRAVARYTSCMGDWFIELST